MMDLRTLGEEPADADPLRGTIGFAVGRPVEPEAGSLTGAGCGEKGSGRLAHRTRDRDRIRETRAGTVGLRIPRLREGSYLPEAVIRLAGALLLERNDGRAMRRACLTFLEGPAPPSDDSLVGAPAAAR